MKKHLITTFFIIVFISVLSLFSNFVFDLVVMDKIWVYYYRACLGIVSIILAKCSYNIIF